MLTGDGEGLTVGDGGGARKLRVDGGGENQGREDGLSKREVMRCLKRYVAREIYRVITATSPT